MREPNGLAHPAGGEGSAVALIARLRALEIQKLKAEISKAEVDRQKAELEIRELTHWYRRPYVLQPVAASIIAAVTAMVGIANGWFSTKPDRLKIEQDTLAKQIAALLQEERDTLKNEASLSRRQISIEDEVLKMYVQRESGIALELRKILQGIEGA